jgi:hypothetical protein
MLTRVAHRRNPDPTPPAAEADLLLACARLALAPSTEARLRERLAGPVDWAHLGRLAARHGLRSLLHHHLKAVAPTAPPRPFFVELWAHRERQAARNGAMATELVALVEGLEGAGLPVLPYKGPALAAAVWGDPALRAFNDLDLLLRPRDLAAAKALLQARGYTPEFDLAPAAEAAFLRSSAQYHLVLVRTADGMRVELHWKTDPDVPVEEDTDAWWEARPRVPFQGIGIRAFAPRELLLVLALHGSKHHWSSLSWLVDVAELLRQQPDLDWDWVFARARALGATRRLALGLHLAHRLLDAPLPAAVAAQAAAAPQVPALAKRIRTGLVADEPRPLGPLARLRLDLALHEGLRRKAAHALHLLFAPSLAEWLRWPLPRGLFFLYAPLRVGRLVGKHVLRREPPGTEIV